MAILQLPKYLVSSTAENIFHLERKDHFGEFPIRFLVSLLAIVCITLNLSTLIRFKPPNHFKTNIALASWVLTMLVQYKILQLGKLLIMAPQRLYTIPDYGAPAEHHILKTTLYNNLTQTIKHIFTLQIASTGVLSISRDAHYALILIPLVYADEHYRFSVLIVYDFYLKLRKTPRLEKAICVICIFGMFQDVEKYTWLVRVVPLAIYGTLSFRVLTSKL